MRYSPEDFFRLRNRAVYAFLSIIIDLFLLAFSCFLSYYLRFFTALFGEGKETYTVSSSYVFYSIAFVIIAVIFIDIFKLYSLRNAYGGFDYYLEIILSIILGILIIACYGYFIGGFILSRAWLLILFVLSTFLLLFGKVLGGIILKKWAANYLIPASGIAVGFVECIRVLKNATRIKRKVIYGIFMVISDIVFFALALSLSFYIRFYTGESAKIISVYGVEGNYLLYSIIFIISAVLIFFLYRLYDWDGIYKGSGYYFKIFKAISINIVILIVVGYLVEAFTFSRIYMLLLLILSMVFLVASRFLILFVTQRLIGKLKLYSNTLIIGLDSNVKRIENTINRNPGESFNIIGYVDNRESIKAQAAKYSDCKILGSLDNLKEIVLNNKIQRIIISSKKYKYFEILDILEELKGLDVLVLMFPGYFEFSIRRMSMRDVSGIPLIHISNIGFYGINLFYKNLIDYILGSVLFVIFIPLYLIVAILIKVNSKGPVFYRQKRYTKEFKEFYMYKFRTMYQDAEQKVKELRKYSRTGGPIFKMKKDPRVTSIGRFLRRFSIDEFPQIINVLKGELSLVGPRPPIPEETEQYEDWYKKRLNIKQGLTGLWQVSGRSDLTFEEMVKLDLYYIQNWSVGLDLRILLKTIPTVLSGKGSY
jgi:exopolysaccharide biosynthesis polyprenyl glycosylphosphotransferase